jgi:FMN phosphatase YigB (HAD superfamily)
MRREPIEGLLFDMGDVLHDDTAWRRWLLQLLSRMGLRSRYRALFRLWDEEYLADVYAGRRAYAEALQTFLLAIGLSRGQIDEVQAASQARQRELERAMRPLPGVRTTINRLTERGLALGVLGDCDQPAQALEERLTRLGLGGRFHVVLSSFDLGCAKPATAGYARALSAMDVSPQRSLFVGHDTAGLSGARAIGMSTAAFNFEGRISAHHYLGRFEELLAVVDPPPIRGPARARVA